MSDLIRRKDAIDAALTFLVEYCGAAFDEDMQKMLCERLDDIPSAEPELTAKVKEGWGLAMCCSCEKRVFPYDKYCSHCGARLEWE